MTQPTPAPTLIMTPTEACAATYLDRSELNLALEQSVLLVLGRAANGEPRICPESIVRFLALIG